MTLVDTMAKWEEQLKLASVVNQFLVSDPTVQQPGFNLHIALSHC